MRNKIATLIYKLIDAGLDNSEIHGVIKQKFPESRLAIEDRKNISWYRTKAKQQERKEVNMKNTTKRQLELRIRILEEELRQSESERIQIKYKLQERDNYECCKHALDDLHKRLAHIYIGALEKAT